MKPNPLTNVLSYPPEAWEAMAVLDFDGEGWREIHDGIQAGENVPAIVIELKHASDVLAAIQRGDEVAMLRALVEMKDAVAKHAGIARRLELNELRVTVREGGEIIRRSRHATEKGFKKIRDGEKAADATHGTKEEREKRYKAMLAACLNIHRAKPFLSLTLIRRKVAREFECCTKTIERHTPSLKCTIKRDAAH